MPSMLIVFQIWRLPTCDEVMAATVDISLCLTEATALHNSRGLAGLNHPIVLSVPLAFSLPRL